MLHRCCVFASMLVAVSGCVSGPAPRNMETAIWAPGQVSRETDGQAKRWDGDHLSATGFTDCQSTKPPLLNGLLRVDPADLTGGAVVLAAGDRLRLDIAGDEDHLTGVHTVQSDGSVTLRGVGVFDVAGLTEDQATRSLQQRLISTRVVQPLVSAVSIRLIESNSVPVIISGAVFQPGSVRPGERDPETRVGLKEGHTTGDANSERSLTAALRAAAGVRPDADVKNVYLIRGDEYAIVDLRGSIDGTPVLNPALAAGDRIIVPETRCFNPDLVRPSALTAPGIRVFMSNLTRSANNNSGAAIGTKTTSLPYGTRMLQGLVAMNCVGGSYMQADRRAVLISRNPRNGQSIVIERDVEELVRSADRDHVDPYLMPGDALACYDSRWTNFREVLGLMSDLANTATPAILIKNAAN